MKMQYMVTSDVKGNFDESIFGELLVRVFEDYNLKGPVESAFEISVVPDWYNQ